jgi:hypothetical protein
MCTELAQMAQGRETRQPCRLPATERDVHSLPELREFLARRGR